MPWESEGEQQEAQSPERDYTKYLWGAVALVIVVALAMLLRPTSGPVTRTEAHVAHILIVPADTSQASINEAYERIDRLRERVLAGESFASLATEYSQDPTTADNGGDVGWVSRGTLADSIDEYIWTAPIGEVSEPIATGFGLHLVKVIDREIADSELYERQFKERVLGDQQ